MGSFGQIIWNVSSHSMMIWSLESICWINRKNHDIKQADKFSVRLVVAAALLQSCPNLRNPIDDSPPGSPIPGILQARTLQWVAISFSKAWKWKVKVKSLSRVRLSATPWTAARQAPPSMGFSRQEYWSGLPLPSPHKAEADVFLELSCLFNDPTDIANFISGSSAFSKTSLNIWEIHSSSGTAEDWLGKFWALLY